MRYLTTVVCALALLAGCGDDKKAKKEAGGSTTTAGGGGAKEVAKAGPDPAEVARLEKRRDEAAKRLQELETAQDEMIKRHEQEKASLPPSEELRALRKSFPQLRRDAMGSAIRLAKMEKRMEALKVHAEGAAAGELKTLREQQAAIEKRQSEAASGWKKARDEAAMGAVEESPVKRDLDAVRAIKQKWFDSTPAARRGKVEEAAKKIINESFRQWLGTKPGRKELCGKVLTQPEAPKGKTPDNFDFTKLDFYILVELYENELDKQNIAVEKKEAAANEAKYWAIENELDGVREKVQQAMQKGGPELEEYLDLQSRLQATKNLDSLIQLRYAGAREVANQVREVQDRQREEDIAASDAIKKARKGLQAAKAALAQLSR